MIFSSVVRNRRNYQLDVLGGMLELCIVI